MKKKIKVGLDFDGVVAYNPIRVLRFPVAYIKRRIFGVKGLNFFYPTANWQKIFWKIAHESSIFPAKGIKLLQQLVEEEMIEAHLVTGRYSFLDDHLFNWLTRYKVKHLFKTINLNKNDEQPHLFKEKIIKKYNLEIFIEDNWDIVNYLHKRSITKVYWIYNILDRKISFPQKFPYIEEALKHVVKSNKTKHNR